MSKVFAHRGWCGKYPENTMLAFQKAIELGVDGIELDVHMTKDQQLVIIHDETVNRTCNGTGRVKDMTVEELKQLDASSIFAGVYGKNEIPTLREYMELVKDLPLITNIELKTNLYDYEGLPEQVYEMIKEFGLQDRIIISSFNHFTVMRMKAIAPELKYGFLSDTWILGAGEYCKKHGVACYHPGRGNCIPELVKEMKDNGREINTWTVNLEEEVRSFYALGIDGIIGNHPDMIKRVLAECEAENK